MEAERERVYQERQVAQRRTAFSIKEEKAKQAAEARENDRNLMALYEAFLPGASNSRGGPKFITDKWGNRVRSGMEGKKKK